MERTIQTSAPPLTANAERLARADPRMEQTIIEESMTDEELTIARECDAQDQAEYSPIPTIVLPVPCRQELFQTQGANLCLTIQNINV